MAIITISRGSFARGKAVAERLGRRLGRCPLSREAVPAQAAKDYGVLETELAEFHPTAESQKRFAGFRLSSRVWATLAKDPATRSAGIDVIADGGNILITGSVGSSKALELLPRIAGAVDGVKAVRCEAGMGSDRYW